MLERCCPVASRKERTHAGLWPPVSLWKIPALGWGQHHFLEFGTSSSAVLPWEWNVFIFFPSPHRGGESSGWERSGGSSDFFLLRPTSSYLGPFSL